MPFKPIINLRATTIAKAFILNAVVLAIIADVLLNYVTIWMSEKKQKALQDFKRWELPYWELL